MNKPQQDYVFYGARCTPGELTDFLLHAVKLNDSLEEGGQRGTPVCIWGRHGVGKTEVVRTLAAEKNWPCAYIAPAQFEEMGDLLGMPRVEGIGAEAKTTFAPPDWVPRTAGPGILLIDDVNRADDRILRGIMQLLQDYRLASWSLPRGWHIFMTANPDGGDYSVTPMDDAMLTRMLHVTLEFDVHHWAAWAERRGIDRRGINFVLTYPEVVTGGRTTPRTLVQFFERIAPIADLRAEIRLVTALGESCLDRGTVAAFAAFVQQNLAELIPPERILESRNFAREIVPELEAMIQGDVKRLDILSAICTRLVNHLENGDVKLQDRQKLNLKAFLQLPLLPGDLRLALAQDLVRSTRSAVKSIFDDPEIGQLLLSRS